MLHHILKIVIFTIPFTFKLLGLINLEDNIQDFVLKTKQIEIPGYPHAFNPSIIKWNDKILMSFRIIPFDAEISDTFFSASDSKIGLIFLDKDFNPIGEPKILDFDQEREAPSRSEDARLIMVSDRLYLVYSDNRQTHMSESGFRMYISELIVDHDNFSIGHTDVILNFEGERSNRREKNWVPFDYQGNLMLAYSLLPHRILYPMPHTDFAETISSTKSLINWKYGELRGGTPGLIEDDEYLSFFHSSIEMATTHTKGEEMPHYFMGAYTFSKEPPFEITRISEKPIICTDLYEGYEYTPYWKPVKVVFPCGFIFDEHFIYISFGKQDHEIWIMKLDKQGLKNSLIPLEVI